MAESSHSDSLDIILAPTNVAVLRTLAQGDFVPEKIYRLRLQAEYFSLIQGFEELLALRSVAVTPFPYQTQTALTVLRRFRGRGLLCDEVGLGKTIEAGLVLKEYLLRGLSHKVLILTPPALVEQWREEMASKFVLDFVTHEDQAFRTLGPAAWARYDRVIASLATARRPDHREAISQVPYDLVIVDEAHHLKNRASVSWKFIDSLQRKYLLLLTATPVQNKLDELYNLITLLKPGQLRSERQFRRQFVVRGDPRLPKNRGLLRELLADVMVRNTRSQVNLNLPRRRAHTVRLRLTPPEQALYDDVSTFVRTTLRQSDESGMPVRDGKAGLKFTLGILQREIGSSTFAVVPTLHRLAAGKQFNTDQKTTLIALADRAERVTHQAKAEALRRLLEVGSEKVLIFTHFLATLEYLAAQLRTWGIPFVAYHGSLTMAQKNEAIHTFEGPVPVLLSTEAAGEGRNLQFCRRMINYDLPWNPMRIEQRVGRLHRIGQTREVEILNLSAEGTVEDYILRVLDAKINMFELVVGEMDMILGNLEDEREFEEIVLDIWATARTPAEAVAGMEKLGDDLVRARQSYLATQAYDEALFGQDFGAGTAVPVG
ncbi:MAG: DEAD/DEAH box helicase [Anaerolineae bacterium]|nr:DEAD/DEAH box helicase [Anaerolineae bacterium]